MASAPPAISARMLGSDTDTGPSTGNPANADVEPSDNIVKYTALDCLIIFIFLSIPIVMHISDTGVIF